MPDYARLYRFGITPWERYAATARAELATLLDQERARRPQPGRALDLGCGRGLFTPEPARWGRQAVGIDNVPAAIDAARERAPDGVTYVLGDVLDPPDGLGTFDLLLDVGCFQGFDAGRRAAYGRAVTRLAEPGATMLQLSFGVSRWRSFVGGVSQAEVESAFPGWELVTADAAGTAGLGWPMNRTNPRWYRFHLPPGHGGSENVRPTPTEAP